MTAAWDKLKATVIKYAAVAVAAVLFAAGMVWKLGQWWTDRQQRLLLGAELARRKAEEEALLKSAAEKAKKDVADAQKAAQEVYDARNSGSPADVINRLSGAGKP